jgi:hypothetical protein
MKARRQTVRKSPSASAETDRNQRRYEKCAGAHRRWVTDDNTPLFIRSVLSRIAVLLILFGFSLDFSCDLK